MTSRARIRRAVHQEQKIGSGVSPVLGVAEPACRQRLSATSPFLAQLFRAPDRSIPSFSPRRCFAPAPVKADASPRPGRPRLAPLRIVRPREGLLR